MRRASEAQADYLSVLFVDCGFTREERKAWLANRFQREIVFLDDLTSYEAHLAIEELKGQKERRWE